MPHCENCGAFVTRRYVRVFSTNGSDSVEACPDCPDKIRRNGKPTEKRYNPKPSTDA